MVDKFFWRRHFSAYGKYPIGYDDIIYDYGVKDKYVFALIKINGLEFCREQLLFEPDKDEDSQLEDVCKMIIFRTFQYGKKRAYEDLIEVLKKQSK